MPQHATKQVVIPLGEARYKVHSSWDQTVVMLSDVEWAHRRPWSLVAGGKVVGTVSVTPLVLGSYRIVVELNQPATPEIRVVQPGPASYLLLSYAR